MLGQTPWSRVFPAADASAEMALPSCLEEHTPGLADDVVDVSEGITNRQAPVHKATPVETVKILCGTS